MKKLSIILISLLMSVTAITAAYAEEPGETERPGYVTEEGVNLGRVNNFYHNSNFKQVLSDDGYFFWTAVDDKGELIKDQIIEHDGEFYGTNDYGFIITRGWHPYMDESLGKKTWHFFDDEGHMYRQKGDTIEFVEVHAAQTDICAFDKNGGLLTGWVMKDGTRTDDWQNADFYLTYEGKAEGVMEVPVKDENGNTVNKTFCFADGVVLYET